MNALSLFSGIGALDLAVAEVFRAHPVAFAELDPNASKVLAARYPGVPNVGDVTAVRWEDWEGVDVLHGGPPCQPTSSAGKRLGENDERWMWPAALDALRRVRPRWVVFENPSALLGLGGGVPFGRILGEMAALGYVGSYGCLRASDVGACHQRDRLWIIARDSEGYDEWDAREQGGRSQGRDARTAGGPGGVASDAERVEPERRGGLGELAGAPGAGEGGDGERQRVRDASGRGGAAAADADRGRLEGGVQLDRDTSRPAADGHPRGEHANRRGVVTADANGAAGHAERGAGEAVQGPGAVERSGRCGGVDWGVYAPAIARHARLAGRPAPAPVDERGRLSAQFVEWMQVLPDGWVTDVLARNPAIKALGNCVVPPCAVAAMRQLLPRVQSALKAIRHASASM